MSTNMKTTNRILSTVLVLTFIIASHFCLIECALAGEVPHHSENTTVASTHHEHQSDAQHSESDGHDAVSTCCSSLVASNISTSYYNDSNTLRKTLSDTAVFNHVALLEFNYRSLSEVEFPPGVIPPNIFLLTHFNHAPPVLL